MKPYLALFVLVGIAALPVSHAVGQTVYKCGTAYSQHPCPGAVPVDVSDSRTPAQKAQSDANVADAAKAAAKMEKERLAREKATATKPLKKQAKAPQTAKSDSAAKGTRNDSKKKKKDPEFFTAAIAPEAKEKKVEKKSGDKTTIAKGDKTETAARP